MADYLRHDAVHLTATLRSQMRLKGRLFDVPLAISTSAPVQTLRSKSLLKPSKQWWIMKATSPSTRVSSMGVLVNSWGVSGLIILAGGQILN
jgi:hypothetical protein